MVLFFNTLSLDFFYLSEFQSYKEFEVIGMIVT